MPYDRLPPRHQSRDRAADLHLSACRAGELGKQTMRSTTRMTLSECHNFLSHQNPAVRRDGAKGLRKFKSKQAFCAVELALRTEKDELVRASLEESLRVMNERRDRTKALKSIPVLFAAVCLSGCLTAPKLLRWELAVYGWSTAKDASAGCVEASGTASAYLTAANKRLATARAATDLESDSTARALMTAAAQACGKEMP